MAEIVEHALGMVMVRSRVGKLAQFAPDAAGRHRLEYNISILLYN